MKAVLIKTEGAATEDVEFDGSLEHAYRLLLIHKGSRLVQTLNLDVLGLPGNGCLMVDEEGGLRPATMRLGQFLIGTFPQRLQGRGLIVGLKETDDGETWDHTPVSTQAVRRRLMFF